MTMANNKKCAHPVIQKRNSFSLKTLFLQRNSIALNIVKVVRGASYITQIVDHKTPKRPRSGCLHVVAMRFFQGFYKSTHEKNFVLSQIVDQKIKIRQVCKGKLSTSKRALIYTLQLSLELTRDVTLTLTRNLYLQYNTLLDTSLSLMCHKSSKGHCGESKRSN